jgi:hypothetical protein
METSRYSITYRISSAILVVCLIAASCKKESNQDYLAARNALVQINDDFIVNSVLDYVKEKRLSPTADLISIKVKTDTYRTSLYIRHTQNGLSEFERIPGQYAIIENFLVLVYSDIDQFINHPSVQEELESVIKEKGLS